MNLELKKRIYYLGSYLSNVYCLDYELELLYKFIMKLNESSEWNKVFPKLGTDNNYNSSLDCIKQLTKIAVSCIMYSNDALPRTCFTEEALEGMNLWILKEKCFDDAAKFLSAALEDAFDALDNKYVRDAIHANSILIIINNLWGEEIIKQERGEEIYFLCSQLHKLALCMYEGECKLGKMTEIHVFQYIYTNEAVSMNMVTTNQDTSKQTSYTFENIRQQAIDFIRASLALMSSCQKSLPTAYGLSLRLYYNADTPAEYHAPGFTEESGADHLDHISLEGLAVGRVQTSYHKLSVLSYVKGHAFRASHEAIPSQNPPMLSNDSEESDPKDRSARSRPRISCPCNKHHDTDPRRDDELLTCHYCNTRQHAACFGVFGDATRLSRHCCADCRDADRTRASTDLKLDPLPLHRRASLCIFRRTLHLCSQRETIDAQILSETFCMSSASASSLMRMLHRHGIILHGAEIDFKKLQNINEKNLKLALIKFKNKREEDVPNRLIGEIEAALSQDSCQFNPLEEVLTPLEKNDLRQTSNLGRVVEKGEEKSVGEDPILNQYREALVEEVVRDPLPRTYERSKGTGKRKTARTAVFDVENKKSRLQLKKK